MHPKIIALLICVCGLLPLAACQSVATAQETGAQTSAPSEADLRECEAITKRILASDERDETFVKQVYTPRLSSLIIRGLSAEPGDVNWIDYVYVYETNGDMPDVLSVGPGVVVGSRITVPVVLQWPTYADKRPKTKTWTFECVDGSWRVADTQFEGRSFLEGLE